MHRVGAPISSSDDPSGPESVMSIVELSTAAASGRRV